ncbi:MAG: YcaO-like family protein [Desulfobacterales bacterium]|nr:YcaO-like family protein [Desulfobacterales bacterium]
MTHIDYRLELETTHSSTGYLSVSPQNIEGEETLLKALETTPMDTFLRKKVLSLLGGLGEDGLMDRYKDGSSFLREMIYETALTFDVFSVLRERLEGEGWRAEKVNSPLVTARFWAENGYETHPWAEMLIQNSAELTELPGAEEAPMLKEVPGPTGLSEPLPVAEMAREIADDHPFEERQSAADTASIAKMKLEALGLFTGVELRHQASLSPVGLMRKWRLDHHVACGSLNYHLSGEQTSYGKGLSLVDARASLYMEVAERHSSYASIENGRVVGTVKEHEVVKARFSELVASGQRALDPNSLLLDVPYKDESLHWMQGVAWNEGEELPIWVPVQAVFLFMNLDEPDLFQSLGSTGLASGNTLEEARLSGLYEALEREAEATQPFDPALCFELFTANENLGSLLSAYRQAGIHLFFQEMTGRFGIPCCKAMVMDGEGRVAKGCSVHLDARRAAVSAMTEVPYGFPEGEESLAPPCKPVPVHEEQLPNYSMGSAKGDVALVEKLLACEGFSPVYVDLTRSDLEIPVVKTLIPGFAFSADFGALTRISPRMLSCAWAMMKAKPCQS